MRRLSSILIVSAFAALCCGMSEPSAPAESAVAAPNYEINIVAAEGNLLEGVFFRYHLELPPKYFESISLPLQPYLHKNQNNPR